MKKPTLYILMRDDLTSLNPGKGMAQAAHAANAFVHRLSRVNKRHPIHALYKAWARETPQGFGTTIVLAGTVNRFEKSIELVESDGGLSIGGDPDPFVFGTINDPTYPLRDGRFTHLIPLDTCCYLFCDREKEIAGLLKQFHLHP